MQKINRSHRLIKLYVIILFATAVTLSNQTQANASDWSSIMEEARALYNEKQERAANCPELTRECAEAQQRLDKKYSELIQKFPSTGEVECQITNIGSRRIICTSSIGRIDISLTGYKCTGPEWQYYAEDEGTQVDRLCETEAVYVNDVINVQGSAVGVTDDEIKGERVFTLYVGGPGKNIEATRVTVRK